MYIYNKLNNHLRLVTNEYPVERAEINELIRTLQGGECIRGLRAQHDHSVLLKSSENVDSILNNIINKIGLIQFGLDTNLMVKDQ